jgi:hypothetical protein
MARTLGSVGKASLVLASIFVAGLGCGGKGKSGGSSKTSAALHVMSAPVHAGQVANQMTYQAVLSQPGAADWTMDQGPHGASIDQGGNVTWTPDETQAGDQAFKISATMNGHTVSQTFTVTAASAVTQTSAHVDPNDPNGGTVTVDAPLSPVQGAAIQIDPGALPPGDPVAVSISSMQHPPTMPASQVTGVNPQDLEPVEIGPSGLTFKKPARLQLPIPMKLRTDPSDLTVMTYDYTSGRWNKVHTLSVDKTSGVAVAEVQHLSTYVVAPDVPVFNLQLGLGGATCAGALVVSAPLVIGFKDVPASAVNGYSGTGATAADVLAGMTSGQALQVYIRVHARAAVAAGEQTGWLLAAATKQDDGTFEVSVTNDSHAGPFLKLPPAGLKATDPELLAWMNGSRADFVFGALGDLSAGAVAGAEASMYLVPGGDADRPPPASANAVGTADVETATLAAAGIDDDCDGAPNPWDPAPAGAAPPVLVGFPGSPVHVPAGSAAPFKVSSPQDGVTFAWAATDPSVSVAADPTGLSAMVTPSMPGLFHVTATGTRGGGSSVYTWDMIGDPQGVAAGSPPPLVAVTVSASVVRVGEPVTLTGLGKDARQAGLSYDWATTDVTTMSATAGQTVVFQASAPGDYPVTCVASNGTASSPPATVTITVLSATANRPPGAPSVSPLSAALTHDPNGAVTLMLTAQATDPDGDAVTYDFAADPATPPTYMLTKNGGSAMFASATDGVYLFYVTATDAKGARGPWAPVKILVLTATGAAPVDADKDGYPAGFDCNDADPSVHPGAKEICGDGKDQDCDGHDLPTDQCDNDGDRYTKAMGDCDDNNPARSPGVVERCDGIDNNCDGVTDEGFNVGAACANGVGACQVMSTTVCSASFVDVVCGGTPGAPKPETCNGIDDDCNGRVDDVPGGATTGDVANCGGCNVACSMRPNSVAACVMGGCVSTCAPGFVDTDRNPANGCECKLTNNGVEICDGLDNDCNGAVDDGASALVYPGMAGTLGVGVCAAGVQTCQNGQLVQVTAPITPTPEVCDGLDNDCNGKVDDTFDFLNDDNNCGGCNIKCTAGKCQQGKCPSAGGDGGVITADGGVPPHDGGADGAGGDAGTMPPPVNASVCPNGLGGTACYDLTFDHANCGACGHACGATESCMNGLCAPFPPMSCGTGSVECLDPSGQKPICANIMFDQNNCGACGVVCPSGPCMGGSCMIATTQPDAGAPPPDAGPTPPQGCPGIAPSQCPGALGSTYCADTTHAVQDCGGCGIACSGGFVCINNACVNPPATGACGGGLIMCATGCTSTQDDARNCGTCNSFCDGSCNSGQCQALGQMPFGSACTRNGDCQGGLCLDQSRFGYPGGFCSSVCDANLPCLSGQKCVGSPTSGGFGACRPVCLTNSDCGANAFCVNNACQPDCRQGPVCTNGQMCDPSGVCVNATQPVCNQPQVSCPTPDGSGTFCTDTIKDPMNCGGCGRVCPGNMVCNNGVCGAQTCAAPASTCQGPAGGTFCADLSHDAANCGACGHACPTNAICSGGACQGGGGSYPGLAACTGAGGAPFCANLLSDPANCGICGNICPGTQGCYNGTCSAGPPPPACPGGTEICIDPPTQKQFCSDPRSDSANCGKCGNACAAGMSCQNSVCMTATAPDGGVMTMCPPPGKMCTTPTGVACVNVLGDPQNCGGCGFFCAAGQYCNNGTCALGAGPDAGVDAGADAGAPADAGTDAGMISCQAGYDVCDGTYCADLMNDPANCGLCHNQCTGACISGACSLPAP